MINVFLEECVTYVSNFILVVIQRNAKDANFARTWDDYKLGFGDVNTKEFWLGLEKMHQLTKTRKYGVEILLKRDDGTHTYLNYYSFVVGDERSKYELSIDGFDDRGSGLPDRFKFHNGIKFTTMDQDNDIYSKNCATTHAVGWWYTNCYSVNLNRWNPERSTIPYLDSSTGDKEPQETKMTLISSNGNSKLI